MKRGRGAQSCAVRTTRMRIAGAAAAGLACLLPAAASAQPAGDAVAQFYRSKTVSAVVGYPAGSTFELYLRMFIRFLPKHLPGNPTVVVQHMPGAGSLTATNYLAAVAPKDGSYFGMPNPVNTIEPLLDPKRTRFDPRTFNWIGSLNSEISTCSFWAKDLKTLADLGKRNVSVGSTGPASGSTTDARVLATLLGLNIKVVTGYPILTAIKLAAERGEVDGFCGMLVSSLKTDFWDDYKAGKFSVAVQMGLAKHPELATVPNAYEAVTGEADKQLFQLIFGPWTYGRPLFAPPGVPAERVAAMRAAFIATVKDPDFLSETRRINMEIQPLPHDVVARHVAAILDTAEPVLVRARELLGVANR